MLVARCGERMSAVCALVQMARSHAKRSIARRSIVVEKILSESLENVVLHVQVKCS